MKELDIKFTDSLQVEESFYKAFRQRDIELMKNVWDNSNEVICIHPGSARIYSFDLIIASWQQIFSSQEPASINISEPVYRLDKNLSVHYVKEILSVNDKDVGSVYATNIYHDTSNGWKMIAHHASLVFTETQTSITQSLH